MFLEFLAGVIAFPLVVAATDLNVWEIAILLAGWFFRRKWIALSAPVQMRYFVDTLCARPWLGISLIALAGPAIRLLLLPIHPIPVPAISDEFSHLLLADTFHLGRWTNPVHPLWAHFESIHIIHRPSYNSMYFPGQGAVLALGMVLGHPWIGVLLSSALFCGSVVWALQAWIPQRWALLGGFIAVLRFGVVSYWVDSYWGGALGALGGCLIAGAYGRLRKQASVPQGLLLGAGLGLLASIRPLEGALFSAAAATTFLHRFGNPFRWQPTLRAAIIVAVCAATACVGMVGYHFYRVTGDPLTPPYAINRQQYGWPMTLPWQKVLPIEHRHREMQQYYEWSATN